MESPSTIQAFSLYPLQRNNPSQEITTETYSAPVNDSFVNQENFLTIGVLSLSLLCFMFLAGIFSLIKRSQPQKNSIGQLGKIRNLEKIPCVNCSYFSNNPYLKCALNPTTVLSDEAINCADYCVKEEIQDL